MKRKKEDNARRHLELKQLSEKMGIAFEDVSLLHKALTHTSYANEFKMYTVEHNERLEFWVMRFWMRLSAMSCFVVIRICRKVS